MLLAPPERINPSKSLASTLLRAPLSSLAPALGIPVEQAVSRVIAAGGTGASADSSIETVASRVPVDAMKLLNAVLRTDAKNP